MWGRMIKRKLIENAVQNGNSYEGVNLRGVRLSGASLDHICLKNSCLWGARLRNCDMGYADFTGADLRNATIENCCFAKSNFTGADLRGASFSQIIWDDAVLDDVIVSCPSFWSGDFGTVASFKGLRYLHKGEIEICLSTPPLVVYGFEQRLVIFDKNYCLWGASLYTPDTLPLRLGKDLFFLCETALAFMNKAPRKMKNTLSQR